MSESAGPSGFVPPSVEALNRWLDGYEVIDLLACGGMGAVYRARQVSLDRLVAIKVLPPELAVDETFRQSFEAEGKAMAQLSHSNLVGVYDFGEISDMLYLVMEFVEGSNLHDSKGDSVIDPETAVTLIRSVASGLAEAHRRGLVHRDIKPANILINTDVVPKLGDFGLAVPDSDVESGLMMGTPAYLAPEVAGDPSAASFASDTYALGVILYEMLTGDLIERGDKLDLSRVPRLGDLPRIVSKAVNAKPLLRYQTGEDLEEALKDWIRKPKGAGLVMTRDTPGVQAKVIPTTTGEGGGLVWGLVALGLVGAIGWFFLGQSEEQNSTGDRVSHGPEAIPESNEKSAGPRESQLEFFRGKQRAALTQLTDRISGELRVNRDAFLKFSGNEGEIFLKAVGDHVDGLPRYLLSGEVEISEALSAHLKEFATLRQSNLERKYLIEISRLHRESVGELRSAEEEVPTEVDKSWEEWVRWLGSDPRKVLKTSFAGVWRLSSSFDGFEVQISETGKQRLVIGKEETEGVNLLVAADSGEITLNHAGNPEHHFPWNLGLSGDKLEGTDSAGGPRVLLLMDSSFAKLVTESEPDVSPTTEMTKVDPEGAQSEEELFKDPEVATLTRNYRNALMAKIGPLEEGYLRVLEGFLKSYQDEGAEAEVNQIEEEIERVRGLDWRAGFIQVTMIQNTGELPELVTKKQDVFQKEFEKRFEPVQRTYLQSLQKMLRVRKGRGDSNIGDIQKAIEKLESPEGSVRARFVKIESHPDEGIRGATIAVIDILDSSGKKIPAKGFSGVKVSSFQERDDDDSGPVPERAIDGNPQTRWSTRWKGQRADFPHWLSFDLGDEYWISGFQLTSRGSRFFVRETDITNWRFYVSDDGRKWTEVAKGNFPKGPQINEYVGFKLPK